MDKENLPEQPVGKKPRLSLSLGKRRFGESVSSNLLELTTPVVPDKQHVVSNEKFHRIEIRERETSSRRGLP